MKKKIIKILEFLINPRLLVCIAIAWMITNGWSYLLFGIGTYFEIRWMISVSAAYLAFLWLPLSPEKLATLAIAIALLQLLFPNDTKTLAVLRQMYNSAKQSFANWKNRKSHSESSDGENKTDK